MTDELLRQLGQVERESRPAEDWDAVLEGELDAEEAIARGQARGEDEDDLRALAAASAPTTASDRAAWAQRARAALDAPGDDDDDEGVEDEAPSEGVEAPIDLAAHRRRRWGLGTLMAVVAIAASLLLWSRMRPSAVAPDAVVPPLPGFTMTVRNDYVQEIRGDEGSPSEGPHAYRVDSELHWVITPEAPVTDALELAAIIHVSDGPACLVRPPASRVTEEGVLQLRGTVGEVLGLRPGDFRVELLVARTGALPDDGSGCTSPRDLPCPCPAVVEPGIAVPSFEPAGTSPGWRSVGSHEMRVEAP